MNLRETCESFDRVVMGATAVKEHARLIYLLGRSVLSRKLARKVPCEIAVDRFLTRAGRWGKLPYSKAAVYVRDFLRFYSGERIQEADPEAPDDLLELSFGENYPVAADLPLDARRLTNDDYDFVDDSELCLMMERRVCPSLRLGCDADDDNVAMRLYLSFGKIDDLRARGALGDGVEEAYAELEDLHLNRDDYNEFMNCKSVRDHLQIVPSKVIAIVEPAG
ncbi:MAG: hypothetical protein ACR2NZ_11380 [Rubripirellula sp.]